MGDQLWRELEGIWVFVRSHAESLSQPDGLLQIAGLLVLFAIAHLMARAASPSLESWIRSLDASKPQLRFLALVLRRLRGLLFVALAWLLLLIMRAVTWPSASYFIGIAANLATAWLVVSIVSRMIRNGFLSALFQGVAWSIAALNILGLTGKVASVLDTVAFSAGSIRISLLLVFQSIVFFTVLMWLATLTSSFIEQRIARMEDVSPSMRVLAGKLARIVLFVAAFLVTFQALGLDVTALTVFSGAVGLGLGFGLQKIVSNLVSGIIILVDRSIKPGDVISLGETFGWITSLGARYVSVVTRDGREFLIPNEDLITNQVINWSYSTQLVRLEATFGVSYDANPHTVRKVVAEAATAPKRVVADPAPVCHLLGFGDSSIDFAVRFWIRDPANGVVNVKGEVLLAVWDALTENGISIPYPQRDLHVKGPVELRVGRSHARTRDMDTSCGD